MHRTVLGLCVVAGLGLTGYLLAGDSAKDKTGCASASLAAKEGGGCCGGAAAGALAGNANYKRANELLMSWKEAPTRLAAMNENEKAELEASFKKLAESHPMVPAFEPTMGYLHQGLATVTQIDAAAKQVCAQASATTTPPAADSAASLASAEGQVCPKTAAAMASATSKMKQSVALTAKAHELMLVAYQAAQHSEGGQKSECCKSDTTAALTSGEEKKAGGCGGAKSEAKLTAAAEKKGGCCGGEAKTTAALASGENESAAKDGGCCGGAKSEAKLTAAAEKKEGGCGGEAKTTAALAAGEDKSAGKKEDGCCGGEKGAAKLTAVAEKKDGGCCADKATTAALAAAAGKPCVKTLVSRSQEVVAASGQLLAQWEGANIRLASMDGAERESVVKLASTVMAGCPIGSRMPDTMETVGHLLRDAATLQAQAMSEVCHNANLSKMVPEASKELAQARLQVLAAMINVLEKSGSAMRPARQVASAQ